jgi:hypothetical protein
MDTRPFSLGNVVITRNALSALTTEDVLTALGRHAAGDWGECPPEDWQENQLALRDGNRLFSVYHGWSGLKFWVISEADRTTTTVLLPDDY